MISAPRVLEGLPRPGSGLRAALTAAIVIAGLGALSCDVFEEARVATTPVSEVLPAVATPAPPLEPGATYEVAPGDTLAGVARRFGVTLEALLEANQDIADPDVIFPGQTIRLPPGAVVSPSAAVEEPSPAATETPALPDLTIVIPPLVADGILVLTVRNEGAGPFEGSLIEVGIFDERDRQLATVSSPSQGLAPGQSMDIRTGLRAEGGQRLSAMVDPEDRVVESDESNNRLSFSTPGS